MKRLLSIFLPLFLFANVLLAQVFNALGESDSLLIDFEQLAVAKTVHFKLVDENTSKPVVLAHVMNVNKRLGVISDMLGYFAIPVSFGDSLLITSIGYQNKSLLSFGQYADDTLFYTITLKPKVYDIEEIQVKRFSTYENFLKSVINLRLPKSELEMLTERLNKYMRSIERRSGVMALPQATSGVMFGKDWYMKQKDKVEDAQKSERNNELINKKFSPGVVEAISGLKGDSLLKFIAFLDFKNDYLLEVTEYEIRVEIIEKLEEFRAKVAVEADSVKLEM